MAATLILYSSVDGQTRRIAERLQQCVPTAYGVTLLPLQTAWPDLRQFDCVVVGASVRYGEYRQEVYQFVTEQAAQLGQIPTAFFTVCAAARRPQHASPQRNRYVQKFLRRTGWQPRALAVFAGRIDYPSYGFWDRLALRMIMKLTDGPTDPRGAFEFTDWAQVEHFGQELCRLEREH